MAINFSALPILILLLLSQAVSAGVGEVPTAKVRLQLNGPSQFRFAGYYAALQHGFYRQEGLEVEILPRDAGQDPLQQVLSEQAEFGIGDSALIAQFANAKPLTLLAAIFQHSAQVLISPRKAGIANPADLAGKRIVADGDLTDFSPLRLLLAGSHYTIGDGNFEALLRGKADAIVADRVDLPYEFDKRGIAIDMLDPRNHGIDVYGDMLFTSQHLASTDPDRVERFRRASLQGWQYALAHEEELVRLLRLQYQSPHPMKALRFEAAEMRKLIQAEQVPLGQLDPRRLETIAALYQRVLQTPEQSPNQLAAIAFDTLDSKSSATTAEDFTGSADSFDWLRERFDGAGDYWSPILLMLALFGYWIFRLHREIEARKHSEAELALLYTNMSLGFALHKVLRDGDGKIVDYCYQQINPAFERMTGIRQEQCCDRTARQLQPNSEPHWIRHFAEVEASGQPKHFESHAQTGNRWYITDCYQAGKDQFVVLMHDISERKLAEDKLRLSARVFSDAHEGIIITDVNAAIVDVNAAFTAITGYSREEVLGKNPCLLKSSRQSADFYREMWQDLEKDGHWQGEIWNRRKNGELFAELLTISALRDRNNQVLHYIGLFSDITESKRQQQELELLAHYDPLTQLPNRTLFADRFNQAIAYSKRTEELLAVCYLDLDGFKQVNDSCGHEIGDQLLMEVARRIKQKLRESDTVCRLGGDEFVLLLENLQSPQQCEETIKRVHATLAEPFNLGDDKQVSISASSGITLYPLDKEEPDILLRHADQAMYQAKQAGRNCYRFHRLPQLSPMSNKLIGAQDLGNDIQQALLLEQFCLYYQPKVNLKTGEVVGLEALVRWQHPQRGLLNPAEFLPQIEGTPLEIELGNWLVRQAFQQLQNWLDQGVKLQISINVSPRFLRWQNFLAMLDSVLNEYPAISSRQIELEVLESSVLEDMESLAEVLRLCYYQFGVASVLDDFGTGYSSLAHLRHLTISSVKIDQSFVRNMLDNPDDQSIVESVIGLAKAFKREVVAEGVETLEDGVVLINLDCRLAQGLVIAPPMPASMVLEWCKNYRHPPLWQQHAASTRNPAQRQLLLLRLQQQHWLRRIQAIQKSPDGKGEWPILIPKKTHLGKWLLRSQLNKTIESVPLQQLQQSLIQQCKLSMRLRQHRQEQQLDEVGIDFVQLCQAVERTDRLLQQLEQQAAAQ